MTVHQIGLTAHQPLAAHGETGIVGSLRNAAALQQRQGTTPGTEEHEGGLHPATTRWTAQIELPVTAGHRFREFSSEALHRGAIHHLKRSRCLRREQQRPGQSSEVEIKPAFNPGGCQLLIRATPLHHQGQPVTDLPGVRAPLHGGKGRQSTQLAMTLLEKGDVLLTPDKTEVGNLVQKAARFEHSPFREGGPELQTALEGSVDPQCLFGAHRSIGLLRGVIQFTVGGMACSGVVHSGTALQGGLLKTLHQQQSHPRIQSMQQRSQGGTHDSRTHQHGVVTVHRNG